MTDIALEPLACASCGKPVDLTKPHAYEAHSKADDTYCTECTRAGRVVRYPMRIERLDAIKARRDQRPVTPPKGNTK